MWLVNLIEQYESFCLRLQYLDSVLGIIMGKNSTRTMAIVRAGGPATVMTEASREFCSVLETIIASGVVIPPLIIWQGESRRSKYYMEGGVPDDFKATFSPSM